MAWTQRISIRGKRVDLGLGGYPLTSIDEARKLAFENAKLARSGLDPRTAKPLNFSQLVQKEYGRIEGSVQARSLEQMKSILDRYAIPSLGPIPVTDISPADIVRVVQSIWSEKHQTARTLLRHVNSCFAYAVACQVLQSNPAEHVASLLPKPSLKLTKTTNRKAIHHGELAEALSRLEGEKCSESIKLLIRFVALTGARKDEARLAKWSEIDLGNGLWSIPASRMKAKAAHTVPLSRQALEILERLRAVRPSGSKHVFLGRGGVPVGTNSASRKWNELTKTDLHGLRSSFRNWCAETGVSREVAEKCLAHAVGSQTERAYNRTDLREQRAAVMQKWADYILG